MANPNSGDSALLNQRRTLEAIDSTEEGIRREELGDLQKAKNAGYQPPPDAGPVTEHFPTEQTEETLRHHRKAA